MMWRWPNSTIGWWGLGGRRTPGIGDGQVSGRKIKKNVSNFLWAGHMEMPGKKKQETQTSQKATIGAMQKLTHGLSVSSEKHHYITLYTKTKATPLRSFQL